MCKSLDYLIKIFLTQNNTGGLLQRIKCGIERLVKKQETVSGQVEKNLAGVGVLEIVDSVRPGDLIWNSP